LHGQQPIFGFPVAAELVKEILTELMSNRVIVGGLEEIHRTYRCAYDTRFEELRVI
jgi:hypothetical protein